MPTSGFLLLCVVDFFFANTHLIAMFRTFFVCWTCSHTYDVQSTYSLRIVYIQFTYRLCTPYRLECIHSTSLTVLDSNNFWIFSRSFRIRSNLDSNGSTIFVFVCSNQYTISQWLIYSKKKDFAKHTLVRRHWLPSPVIICDSNATLWTSFLLKTTFLKKFKNCFDNIKKSLQSL